MGGSQSRTRKLTVENDDPASIIKVSDDVVQRIKNSQGRKPAEHVNTYSRSHQAPQGTATAAAPLHYAPPPTTIQMRQANLEDLKQNDAYWLNRLITMQENHKKINEILEAEFQKAVEERACVRNEPEKAPEPLCKEIREEVKKCYELYPNETMRCAKVVKAFQECVDSKRTELISSRG